MRPDTLSPLFRPVTSLKGVGPAVASTLRKLLQLQPIWGVDEPRDAPLPVVRDLLFHVPSGVTDRRICYKLADAPLDSVATLQLVIDEHHPTPKIRGRKPPYRISCHDDSADMILVFFAAKEDYLRAQLPVGQTRIISGRLERFDGVLQMTHPDVIAKPEQREQVLRLEPNYPLTAGLHAKKLRELIQAAAMGSPDLAEWIDASMVKKNAWQRWVQTLQQLHHPQSPGDIDVAGPLLQRLAYDEILANQLALALVRRKTTRQAGIVVDGNTTLRQQVMQQLPFALTAGQNDVLAEIDRDISSGQRMQRLLQGDVGSGKTIVALLAMLPLIEAGYQCALMVPTEILGRQHLASFDQLLLPLGIRVAMLTGKLSAADKRRTLDDIEHGHVQIIIGTHALFQQSVSFYRLGLVVIDEQHRFGVNQRLALSSKGQAPHMLLMTATPIPRSLTMTAYGDMESSQLTEKPANRLEISTHAVPLSRIDEVVEGLRRAIAQGNKVYWICPLVEENEEAERQEGDLAAAEERYRVFRQLFGERVALAHGKMKPAEREASMQAFAGEGADILVATTVVEVGVNVPEATIIVIEHAERFGLAQLHQLRGRVGRGDKPSSCILLYSPRCSQHAQQRMRVIRETNDGFRIAEEDLMLRGAGDVLGTRQSGLPQFRFVDLAQHRDLILAARDDVKLILHRDETLQSDRGKALRALLYLMGYDKSLQYLKAG